MKLVAQRDFFNAKGIGVKPDQLKAGGMFRHENHVHKGCRFTIGASDVYKDLSNDEQYAVGTLISRGMAVMDTTGQKEDVNGPIIAKIDAEAKAEYEAHKSALAPRKSFIAQLAEVVAVAVAKALADSKAKA
jgi:hypothetical protein